MSEAESDFGGSPRFEVRRRIGSGGMGVVYEAWDREHQMRVALKTLPVADPNRIYQFKQEFRNLAGIVHPNLATLYELFAFDGTWFFTMELVDGRQFLEYVRDDSADPADALGARADKASHEDEPTLVRTGEQRARPQAPGIPLHTPEQYARLRSSLLQLAEAVETLHASGKLHRDIKPSNVLVTPEGRTALLDFGLTIAFGREGEEVRSISGTIPYMSPEQALAEPLSAASDWYSVGVMLYEALTGSLPFEGTASEVMRAKVTRVPVSPGELHSGVPADLEQLCRDLLQREPARRPTGAKTIERLGGDSASRLRVVESVPLIGRTAQLRAMHEAFERARSGRLVTLLVHGASGEGKSFLVQQFFDELSQRRDTVILAGRCYETESVPYKALDSLIDALAQCLIGRPDLAAQVVPRDAGPLTRVFPSLNVVPALARAPERPGDASGDQEARLRASRGLRELLSRLGDRVPLVLSIDDLQWGDLDSGMILSEVLRGPDPPTLLFVGVYRSEHSETSPILSHLRAASADPGGAELQELAIGVLSDGDSRALALEILRDFGDGREAAAEAVARESGGVPYFVYELARFIGEGATLTGERISLEEVLARRFEALEDAPRALLETIALAGQPIRQRDAYLAAGLEAEERAVVTQLRAGHFVRSSGPGENDAIEPYHDRIRETLVELTAPSVRTHRHRQLALTLELSGAADPETLAVHFRGAGELARAAEYYTLGARKAAAALAFDRAAKLDHDALELLPAGDARRRELLVHRADALANAGRGPEAAAEYEAALEGASPLEAIDLRRKAAYQYCVSGHINEGRGAMRRLLGQYRIKMPESAGAIIVTLLSNRLRLWFRGYEFETRQASEIEPADLARIDVVWSAAAGLSMNDIIAGAALQTRGLLIALDSGSLEQIGRSMAWEATHKSNDGSKGWKTTAMLLDLAQRVAEKSGHPHPLAMATLARGIAEFTMGRWATALPLLDEAEESFRERCTGVAWELDTAHAFALWALVYMGDFDEMSRRTSMLLKEADERGDLYAATTLGVFHRPHALLSADDPRAARDTVAASIARWTTNGFYLQDLCALMTEALIDTYEGDGATGYDRWMRNWPAVKSSQLLRSQCIRSLTHHFRARAALAGAVRGGRPDLVRAAVADAKRIRDEGVAWCEPYAQVLFAGVERIRGNVLESARLYEESAKGLDRVNMRSHAESARYALGDMLGGSEGERLRRGAEEWMASKGIRNARAMARMHIGAIA
ncbi:MAG: protein kinase [Thermoanaerobaculia bacterium]